VLKSELEDEKVPGSLLATAYPDAEQWKQLVVQFDAKAIAHKLLLAHIPYVFRDEPLKFALFRRTIADAFKVEPSNVFIVGSAMAGRSLKGKDIEKEYSSDSDIDTLIVSEHLFASYVIRSMEWLNDVSKPDFTQKPISSPTIPADVSKHIGWLSMHACKGIWRPDSLPKDAPVRRQFFDTFSDVSLKTLGLQLSEDTVAKVNGRIARSFDDAMRNLADSILHLAREFEDLRAGKEPPISEEDVLLDDSLSERLATNQEPLTPAGSSPESPPDTAPSPDAGTGARG